MGREESRNVVDDKRACLSETVTCVRKGMLQNGHDKVKIHERKFAVGHFIVQWVGLLTKFMSLVCLDR